MPRFLHFPMPYPARHSSLPRAAASHCAHRHRRMHRDSEEADVPVHFRNRRRHPLCAGIFHMSRPIRYRDLCLFWTADP